MSVSVCIRVASPCFAVTLLALAGACTGEVGEFTPDDSESARIAEAPERFLRMQNPVPGQYIAVLRDDPTSFAAEDVSKLAATLAADYRGEVSATYQHALRGFAASMSEDDAKRLASDPRVAYVEQNSRVKTSAAQQNNPTWGLNRIDQRSLPLDNKYIFENTAANVTTYVIDTGIRKTHVELGTRVEVGVSMISDGRGTDDCHGHGTHVAGTIGGATFGVAKNIKLVPVRVLGCDGEGDVANVVAGIDWVTANRNGLAIVNFSLSGDASSALDDAVEQSIASGLLYAVAAGNENRDACLTSPGRVFGAMTVAATRVATTPTDWRSSFSNYGPCVDIFAPGSNITSAGATSDTATVTLSGTSTAVAHVTGVAALYLSAHPDATPAQIANAVKSRATPNKVTDPKGSPNLLLYSR